MVNQYTLPSKAELSGPPDASKVSSLKYTCLNCNSSCNQASALEAHVNGKSHAKKTTAEDSNIVSKLAQYAKLETPHRNAKKQQSAAGGKSFMEKMFEFRASMTKEQLKEHEKEKKRKRAEEGTVRNNKKKKPTAEPYKCGCCDKELEAHSVQGHMSGGTHFNKVKKFDGGCWLCNVPSPAPAEHFEGRKHMSRINRLAELGVSEEAIYAMTQAAAVEVGTGMTQVGHSAKAKKKGGVDGAMTGQGKSSKAKKKANKSGQPMQPREPKGDPNDMTCWDFKNGKCRKGEKCKWEHA